MSRQYGRVALSAAEQHAGGQYGRTDDAGDEARVESAQRRVPEPR